MGCKSKDKEPPAPPPVTVENPQAQEITPYLYETGNMVASLSIDVVARVAGYLESYRFKEGSQIKKGDLLFVIQPEPYADDVIEAQATLDSDVANLAYDKVEYERQLKMYKRQATSLANLQQAQSTLDAAAAAVAGAEANLKNTKITYSYTHVLAPVDGRVGRSLVDTGNLVGEGESTKLTTIEQIDPMYVYFSINELELLKIREAARKIGFKPSEIDSIPVEVALQNETGFPHKGYLDFAASELDADTGTIQMRGILPNADNVLLPGLFVKVRIPLGKPAEQLTLPNTAVMYDQVGAYVFTVDGSNKVFRTRVETGSTGDDERIAILKGLNAQESVIVNGLQNATPGGTVAPSEKKAL